jgi:hypothetical protein
MNSQTLSKFAGAVFKKRTLVVYLLLAVMFSSVLQSSEQFSLLLLVYTASFWVYSYIELQRKYFRPRNPEIKATLKISTEPFVDWAITTMQGELVVSGWGNRTVVLPSTGIRIERARKVKFSEYVYVAEVISGNGDAFVSLTVDDDDEFSQTVACGRSGDPEVLYTYLNTGYGTKHWLLPRFMQGIPA